MHITFYETSAPILDWASIASDSTGRYLAAVANKGGGIYCSNDYGSTWRPASANSTFNWVSIASDSTGQFLLRLMVVESILA